MSQIALQVSNPIQASFSFEGESIPADKLPQPAGWRLLVGMIRVNRQSVGGIVLVDETVQANEYLRYVGKVLAAGDACYQHEKFRHVHEALPRHWCRVGNIVAFGKYEGQNVRCQFGGEQHTLRLMNDDSILCVIPDISILDIQ